MVDKTSLNVEDPLQVTVQTSEPEDDAVPPEITLTYDANLLKFTYCSVEYGGGEGGLITIRGTVANLAFEAKKSGTATLSAEAIIDEDGNNRALASKSVSITGSATEAPGDAGSQTEEAQLQQEVTQEEETDSSGENRETDAGITVLSSNAHLKRFKPTDAKLKPKFSGDVTDYTVTLKGNDKQLRYKATTEDENAQIIAASGFSNLKNGTNKAVLTVRAQDGTTMAYTFTIVKEGDAVDPEDTTEREVAEAVGGFIPIEGSDLYVNTTFPEELLPEGFLQVDYVYKEQYVEAAFFEPGEMMLLYLSDMEGSNGGFYIYYSGTDEFMDFIQLKGWEGHFIFPIQFPLGVVIPDGFQDASMQWNDKTVPAFMVSSSLMEEAVSQDPSDESLTQQDTLEDDLEEEILAGNIGASPDDYYLLYAMNQDGGEGFYMYDSLEGTYQRFLRMTVESEGEVFDDENYVIYKAKSQRRMVVIGVLIIVVVLLLFLLLNMYLQQKEWKEEDDSEADDEESQEEKYHLKKESERQKEERQRLKAEKEKKKQELQKQKEQELQKQKDQELQKRKEQELQKRKEQELQKQKEQELQKLRGVQQNAEHERNGAELSKQKAALEKQNKGNRQADSARRNGPVLFDLRIDDSLTPKMQREQLDNDFEFEFINIDED